MNASKYYRWLEVVVSEGFFGSKLIILRSDSNVATFWISMDATFFGISRFEHISPYRRSK